ncbi:MAG TPA: hypothetical protein VKR30_06125 [Candidatus Limnocylindrales bacterium]|nr:hypothetical protein [Candidatus Limnocylindrales bacterium]
MRRDLDPIELPPPPPDYGTPIDEADELAEAPTQKPIDDLDLGTDPEHLGTLGREPVQERSGDGPELDRRQKLAKTIDPSGDDATKSSDPNAEEPRGW